MNTKDRTAVDPAEEQPSYPQSREPARREAETRREVGARREAEARADQPVPAVPQVPPAPPDQPRGNEAFFPPERREELKRTWVDIQSAFIDEPQRAVRNADGLVREILGTVSQKFEGARRGLEAEWDKGEQASTEALRVALQRYRALFERLLSL